MVSLWQISNKNLIQRRLVVAGQIKIKWRQRRVMRKKIIYAARTRAKKIKFEYEEKDFFKPRILFTFCEHALVSLTGTNLPSFATDKKQTVY